MMATVTGIVRIFGNVFARVADTRNNFAHLAQWKQPNRTIFLGQLFKQVIQLVGAGGLGRQVPFARLDRFDRRFPDVLGKLRRMEVPGYFTRRQGVQGRRSRVVSAYRFTGHEANPRRRPLTTEHEQSGLHCGVRLEQIRWQADDAVNAELFEQHLPYPLFRASAEQEAGRQRHDCAATGTQGRGDVLNE